MRQRRCLLALAWALLAAACGSPSAPPVTTIDTTPDSPQRSLESAPDATRTTRETTRPVETTSEPGPGGGGAAHTCVLLEDAVLPRCTTDPEAEGCPFEVSATANVSIEVLSLVGYDDLGTHAFEDHVPLLLSCYGESMAAAPEAPSVVQVTLDVASSGCARVRRTSGDWPTRRLRDCARGVLEWMALPGPTSTEGGTLELQIEFAP